MGENYSRGCWAIVSHGRKTYQGIRKSHKTQIKIIKYLLNACERFTLKNSVDIQPKIIGTASLIDCVFSVQKQISYLFIIVIIYIDFAI